MHDTASPNVRALLRAQGARARDYYGRATRAIPPDESRRLIAAEIMSGIYQAILAEIERRDFDVFGETVRVSRPRRAWIALTHLDADDVPRQGSLRRGVARGQPPLRRPDVARRVERRVRHHRHRRGLRRPVGGGSPGRGRAPRPRPRSARTPRRARHRVRRSRDRLPRRQRPARPRRLLPRDLPLPRRHRRPRSRGAAGQPRRRVHRSHRDAVAAALPAAAGALAPGRRRRALVRRRLARSAAARRRSAAP